MALKTHPFFRWPGSLFWLLPLAAAILSFWRLGEIGSVWWYLVVLPLVAMSFIDLFTTVWFGVVTLCSLFLYCSVGSAGVPVSIAIFEPDTWKNVRETMEMTEFEWFHWWPFKWLVATLCLNMSIVTVRRIPLNLLTVGVWSIHTGIIVMVIGSVIYFGQKIEGDVLISRNRVVIKMPGEKAVSMVAAPDNSVSVGQWTFAITNLNPNWELMSGDDVGKKVYAVSVSVQGPDTSFIRQLISGYPQYTEDIVSTGDTSKPMARAIKSLGRALVDDSIVINLTHDVKDRFFVTQSAAVYMREVFSESGGLGNWVELPIDNLPRFNDHMPTSEDVWNAGTDTQLSPLTLSLTTNEENIQVQQEAVVTGYLRYAFPESRIVSGDELFPVVWITLRRGNESAQSVEMYAFNESLNTADPSLMTYRWVEDESELALLGKSLPPSIICNINSEEYVLPVTNNDEFGNIGDSEYAYRVLSVQNNLRISGVVVSLAQVEIKKGAKTWERWVFDNRSMNRDVIEGEQHNAENATFVDDAIQMKYSPGGAPITIVGGLEDGSYGLLSGLGDGEPQFQALVMGQQVPITDEVSLTLDRAESRTTSETRLTIVPRSQRDPAASNLYSMIKLVLPTPEGSAAAWLPYHQYPFKSESDTVHRFRYDPTLMQLPNGKTYQVLFSRRSEALPAPVVLDSFEIDSHVGGFTGRTSSVLNWRSLIRFLGDKEVSAAVSVNDPRRFGNYWFFQSQWDPPDSTSAGLNYTVLGVGNRFGVLQMLLGCCLTVSGMLWAFYVKPMIKRRRQQAVYEGTGA